MHILLINVDRKTEVRIPQGLLYLASAAHTAGHKVTLYDEALAPNRKAFLDEIVAQNADVVGLSVYSVPWQLRRIEDISHVIKSSHRSIPVIWGGWHPTLYPKQSILNEDVDIVVRGPGEKILCDLLDSLEQGKSLKDITGLVYKDNGQILETGPACLDPQYLYPRLNFKLIDVDGYLRHHDRGSGILQYISSRGCHGRCRFCVMARLFKGNLARKPKDRSISELKYLVKNYSVRTVHFSDDNAFRNDETALELCDIIHEATDGKGIPWRCATRIDTLSRLSRITYESLTTSGCKGFVVGIESGDNRVLNLMRKSITKSQIDKALKNISDSSFHSNMFCFLFGFPGETEKEAHKTLNLARKIRLMFPYSDIALYVYSAPLSDNSWLPTDVPVLLKSRLSAKIADYDARHAKLYRLKTMSIRVLRYYFAVSKQETDRRRGYSLLYWIRLKLALLRIRSGIFVLPFEYCLNVLFKQIRNMLYKIRSTRQQGNNL